MAPVEDLIELGRRLFLAAAFFAPVAAGIEASELPVVRVAYHPNLHGAGVVALGEEKGYFADAGIRVEARRFLAGPPELQAIVAGDIDVGFLGTGALAPVMEGKGVIVAIDLLGLADEVLARPERGIESAADLAGKRVITTYGTSGEMILRIALERARVDPSTVEIEIGSPEIALSAFRAGDVDALALWQPLTDQARIDVPGARTIASGRSLYPETVFPIVWVANRAFAEKRPDLLRRFLAAARRAIDHRATNLDETIEIIAERAQVPVEILRAQKDSARFLRSSELDDAFRDGTARGWLAKLGELFVAMERVSSANPPEAWFDPDHFLHADEEVARGGPAAARDGGGPGLLGIVGIVALTAVLSGVIFYSRHRRA